MDEEQQRPKGTCEVDFNCHSDAVAAMAKDKQCMGHRYIEMFLKSDPGRNDNGWGNNSMMNNRMNWQLWWWAHLYASIRKYGAFFCAGFTRMSRWWREAYKQGGALVLPYSECIDRIGWTFSLCKVLSACYLLQPILFCFVTNIQVQICLVRTIKVTVNFYIRGKREY